MLSKDKIMAARQFVGRELELAEIRSAIDDTLAGHGRLLLFTGEPGIGKTRLAGEAGTVAASCGIRVLWGRCWQGGGVPPYWPWIEIVRGLLGSPDHQNYGSLERWPELAVLMPELASSTPSVTTYSSSSEEGGQLFDAMTRIYVPAYPP